MPKRSRRQSPIPWLVGSFSEAWIEVRVHRARTILSLVGVAVAVTAITSVSGLGGLLLQESTVVNAYSGGRPATIAVTLSGSSTSGASRAAAEQASIASVFDSVAEDHRIRYHSQLISGSIPVQFTTGAESIAVSAVDVGYGAIHDVPLSEGSWFVQSDAERLAPALVVNAAFWAKLGSPALATHPTVRLLGDSPETGVVIGVEANFPGDAPAMMMLVPSYRSLVTTSSGTGYSQFEAWVPASMTTALMSRLKLELRAAVPRGITVDVSRQDQSFVQIILQVLQIALEGVAGLVLFLGALGLVNISLVTVRARVREIGIRRSFGATAGRVFFAIMMESVVATFAAGVVGVGVAVLIIDELSPLIISSTGMPVSSAFPIAAAVQGLVTATVVGALAGLLPAVAAVRLKVIDAIRY